MFPLTPDNPALGVDNVIAPEDVDVLDPVVRVTAPPVPLLAIPADIVSVPPELEPLDPTEIRMLPAVPEGAEPVVMYTVPVLLLPAVVTPVLKEI